MVATGQGLLPVAAGFFRTTRDPSAPPPPSVPTLLAQLSTLALLTPPAEGPCENAQHEKIYCFLLTGWILKSSSVGFCFFIKVQGICTFLHFRWILPLELHLRPIYKNHKAVNITLLTLYIPHLKKVLNHIRKKGYLYGILFILQGFCPLLWKKRKYISLYYILRK